ncbi:PREDICTED: gamma-1-syntrophin-like [Hipposideros armiger]|uniref:Gamma-1-syntrophin-like n=1 Tax=Hipposideros armiger TaxID=186990 RepID=A0A8B7QHV9_HIPAR|nr:PREDICTED: gamma-1-syntrophin-like [Hipposideros armiger]
MDFRTACEETKTGVCLLQDGNQEPFKVRLHLAKDILMIQEQDVICVSGEPLYSGFRVIGDQSLSQHLRKKGGTYLGQDTILSQGKNGDH